MTGWLGDLLKGRLGSKKRLLVNATLWLLANAALIVVLLLSTSIHATHVRVVDSAAPERSVGFPVGSSWVITLGNPAYAAGAVDYTLTGVNDNVPFLAALNALPATGGRLVVVSAVGIHWANGVTVTRAISNVTIQGSGLGTSFTGDGVTPEFTVGGNGWVFESAAYDVSPSMGAASGLWSNVSVAGTYYTLRTFVNGNVVADTVSTGDLVAPTGRGATLTVAANNANAVSKAQADYVCDSTADNVEIQAAITALPVAGGTVQLTEGQFNIVAALSGGAGVSVVGHGIGATTVTAANNVNGFQFNVGGGFSYNAGTFSDMTLQVGGAAVSLTVDNLAHFSIHHVRFMSNGTAYTTAISLLAGAFEADVYNNRIQGFGTYGISSAGNGVVITNNDIAPNDGATGIYVNAGGHRISKNWIEYVAATGGTAVDLHSGASVVSENLITVSKAGSYGVYVSGGSRSRIDSNIIDGLGTLVYIGVGTGHEVSFNRLYYSGDYAIRFITSRNQAIGNFIETSGAPSHGIMNDNQDYQIITGNHFTGGGGIYAINLVAGNYNVVTGNFIYGYNRGVYLDGTGIGNLVYPNTFYGVTAGYEVRNGMVGNAAVSYVGHSELFMDCLVASATGVRSNEDLSAATPITFTLSAQPDVPRNLTWSFDSHAQITAYSITVAGVNAKGKTVTETFTEASGWSGTLSQPYATVTSITMTSRTGTGVGDTMDIGTGSKLGLTNELYATGDVYKAKKNNADYPAASYTVNATYDTVDVSTGGAIVGGDDFTIWYGSSLNVIG